MTTAATEWLREARQLLEREYGITGTLSALPGENRNALVETPGGEKFVLKLAPEERTADVIAFEHALVEHLAAHGSPARPLALPRTVPATSGRVHGAGVGADARPLRAQLLTFVAGAPWGIRPHASRALLRALGSTLADVTNALGDFAHPSAARTHRWDMTRVGQHWARAHLIDRGGTARRRQLADRLFMMWASAAEPYLNQLPHSVIYGDANDENVLVEGDRVTGLLDFGDAMLAPTICELAVAVTYAMLDQPDPLSSGAEVVAGYEAVRPLSALERDVLFPMVCGRLAASVTVAAERRAIDPHHPNWFLTEPRAWALIEQLARVDPADAGRRLLGASPEPRAPLSETDLLAGREAHIGKNLSVAYREPLAIARGAGPYLIDRRGRPFLDLVNNVCHVGHCHPRVVDAGRQQMARLNTNTRYLHETLAEYARRLTATLPSPLEVCFFVNSGSEANELALRLARAHTGRHDVLVVDEAYHGNTSTLVAMSPYKFKGPGGTGAAEPWVNVAPIPDSYRGAHRGRDRSAGIAYGDAAGAVLGRAPRPVAAFLVESLMSCAGQIVPPPGYLETAFAHVRAAGGVCIVDEVQSGFGRAGACFWGFELQHVIPDIVVMGKPIGNGHPIGAVVTTRAIAESFANGMEFFSTFGGNPVSCAIGLAVLDAIEHEQLQRRAAVLGERLMSGLRALQASHAIIGDVRGSGLFIGVELVRDRDTLEAAPREASDLINRLKDRGILLSTDGPFHNVLKIKPPMVLSEADVDMVIRGIDEACA